MSEETTTPEAEEQDIATLILRWTNTWPALPSQLETPSLVVDDPEDGNEPRISFYDWEGIPDTLSVGLVVQALDLVGINREQIPSDATWLDLLALLGPDVRDIEESADE